MVVEMARQADRSVAEKWRERVQRQARSGLSIAAFCHREGISQPSFYQWRKRLATEPRPAESPWFVPVQVAEAARAAEGVEIELPGGALVRLPAEADLELVCAAIQAAVRAGWEVASC